MITSNMGSGLKNIIKNKSNSQGETFNTIKHLAVI